MPSEQGPTLQKRVTVKAACEECRLRKTKCDGARPTCTRCHKRRRPCEYKTEPEESRNEALRRVWNAREEQVSSLCAIVELLRTGTDEQALVTLHRIRNDQSIPAITSSITSTDSHSIENLRELYSKAQAAMLDLSPEPISNVTSPVSEWSGSGASAHSRAASESSNGSRTMRAPSTSQSSRSDRLALDFIMNSGAAEAPIPTREASHAVQPGETYRLASSEQRQPLTESTFRQHVSNPGPQRPSSSKDAQMTDAPDNTGLPQHSVDAQDFAQPHNESFGNMPPDWNKYYSDVSSFHQQVQKPASSNRPL